MFASVYVYLILIQPPTRPDLAQGLFIVGTKHKSQPSQKILDPVSIRHFCGTSSAKRWTQPYLAGIVSEEDTLGPGH